MTSEPISAKVVARYPPRSSCAGLVVVAIGGAALLAFLVYQLIAQSGEQRLAALTLFVVLAVIGGVFGVTTLVKPQAVEVTASGTIDFVSPIRREAFPRTALVRVEGQTTRSGSSSRSPAASYNCWAKFIFIEANQTEAARELYVPRPDDPALQEFVRQLERLNPKLDASQFWAWSRGAEAAR
jgi:hypothetical protein